MNATQAAIIKAFRAAPHCTRRELEAITRLRTGSICGRVSELLEANKIEVCGTRYDRDAKRHVELLRLKQ